MRELMSYLPENYPDSQETVTFQEALQTEANLMWQARDELQAQLNPYTATWGLWYWEDALGLGACEGLELDVRRRQIVAKLQGRGTTTPAVVKAVAETMLWVPVRVIEIFGECRVELEVDSNGYLPAGTDALKRRLWEIMPAHLDWALVIPTWLPIPIRAALGPRMGRSTLPRYRAQLPTGKLCATAVMGMRSSTVTLTMYQAQLPAGKLCATAVMGVCSSTATLPMRAYHEQEVNY